MLVFGRRYGVTLVSGVLVVKMREQEWSQVNLMRGVGRGCGVALVPALLVVKITKKTAGCRGALSPDAPPRGACAAGAALMTRVQLP